MASSTKYNIIDNNGIYIRKYADIMSAKVCYVPYTESVELLEESGLWSRVKYNNFSGWVTSKDITKVASTGSGSDSGALYTFKINDQGHLIVGYSDVEAPALSIDETGHLVYTY